MRQQLLDLQKRNTDLSKGLGRSPNRAADEKAIASGIAKAKLLLSGSALSSSIATSSDVINILQKATKLLEKDQAQKSVAAGELGINWSIDNRSSSAGGDTPSSSVSHQPQVLWSATGVKKVPTPAGDIPEELANNLRQLVPGTEITFKMKKAPAPTTAIFKGLSSTGMVEAEVNVKGVSNKVKQQYYDPSRFVTLQVNADVEHGSETLGGTATPPALTAADVPGMEAFYGIIQSDGAQTWHWHNPNAGGGIPGNELKYDGCTFANVLLDQKYVRWIYLGDESFGRDRRGARGKPYCWDAFKQFRSKVRGSEAFTCERFVGMKEGHVLGQLYDLCDQVWTDENGDIQTGDGEDNAASDAYDAPEVSEDDEIEA